MTPIVKSNVHVVYCQIEPVWILDTCVMYPIIINFIVKLAIKA